MATKGYESVYMPMSRFYAELTDRNTMEERGEFATEFARCIIFQQKGVNSFADFLMTETDNYREDMRIRQQEYRNKKKNSESASEDVSEAAEITSTEEPAKKPRNKRKKTDDSDNPEKNAYGEAKNVFLTDREYAILQKRNGANIDRVIEKISSYKASNGKVYSSDYSAIINWVENEVRQEIARADNNKTFKQRDREDSARRAREAFPEVMEAFGL